MPKLNIRERSREGLSKLLSLDPGLFDRLVVTLERQAPSVKIIINPSAVVTVSGIDNGDLEKILRAVGALYVVYSFADVPLDTFITDVSEAIEGFDAEVQSAQSKDRLRRVLGVGSLASSSKALTLLTDQERTLHGVQILTDVRHAFQPDPEKEPYGAVIFNVLKLTYHEGDQHKDFYIALDGDDLASLRTALDRAEAKIKTLRADIDSWRKVDAPKEGTAGLRRTSQNDDSLAWVGAHWRELIEQYPNRWILVADKKVAADAATPRELAKEAGRLGIKRPFITKIGQGPVVWRTAYAR